MIKENLNIPSDDDREFARLHDIEPDEDEIKEIEVRLRKFKSSQPLEHEELGKKEFDEAKPEDKN